MAYAQADRCYYKFMHKLRVLWLSLIIYGVMMAAFYAGSAHLSFLEFFVMFGPIVLLFLYATQSLSVGRFLIFFGWASGVGLLAEVLGMKYGTLFGGHYIYSNTTQALLGVPITVVLYWAIFIMVGYGVVNAFWFWLDRTRPTWPHDRWWKLVPLVALDGLVVTIIDLIMDPVQVHIGAWKWLEGGPYFGVPLGNFVGWWMVVVIVSAGFRWLEYRWPRPMPEANPIVHLVPVLGYALIGFTYAWLAWQNHQIEVALIAGLLFVPIILTNLCLFAVRSRRQRYDLR